MALPFIANPTRSSTPGDVAVGGKAFLTTTYLESVLATAQAVATGTAAILIPAGSSFVRITAAAATTGATLPVGDHMGQLLVIDISTAAANTVTFAAVATSHVAGGAAVSLAGLAAHMFIWDSVVGAWFQIGPLTN